MTIRSRARTIGAVVAMVLASLPFVASPAAAESGADVVEACDPLTAVEEIGPRACGGLERGLWFGAQHCRRVADLEEEVCPTIDGREVHEAAMVEFEQSWTARALGLQADLDREVPLTEALVLHTHNSANSAAYDPSFTSNDANQVLTITDQLRLGIRGIEIDVHWAPHPEGDPEQGFRAPVQCHGQSDAGVHAGCSVDQLLVDLLDELSDWLDEHPDELVLLYLENHLDEDDAAHATTVSVIEDTIGDLVYRPAQDAGCQDLPVDRSKADILDTGARVLLTGNCGPGGWNDWVFQRNHGAGGTWNESGSTTTFDCDADRAAGFDYDETFVRRYEDSTFLSLMANGGSYISPEVAASLVRCGVNMPGLDQLHPGDERLAAFVWSWRDQEPVDDPDRACAAQGDDARFVAVGCSESLPVACRADDGTWAVTEAAVPWAEGDRACTDEGHAAAGVPANGWDNHLLREAVDVGPGGDAWLAYGRSDDGRWVTGIPGRTARPGQRGNRPPDAGPPAGVPGRPGANVSGPSPGPASAPDPAPGLDTDHASTGRVLPGAGLVLVLVALGVAALGPGLRRRRARGLESEPAENETSRLP